MGAPALMDAQADQILARMNALISWAQSHVLGGLISDGGTTQGSGAGVALNFDVDVTAIKGVVDNFPVDVAAGTDVDATAGISFGATSGKSVVYAVVIHTGSGGATAGAFEAIPGEAAATGLEVAPTEAEIETALGHAHFAIVGDVTVTRTADTTVTLAVSYARRFNLGSGFPTELAATEAAFRAV